MPDATPSGWSIPVSRKFAAFPVSKLPDVRAFFATVSLHTSTLHPSLLRRRCGVEEYSGTEPKGQGRAKRVE